MAVDKRRELQDIDTNIMQVATHKWFGDVLVAQERGTRKWVVFWPESGKSEPVSSYREAVSRAKGRRNPSSKSITLKNMRQVTITRNQNGTVSVEGVHLRKTNAARKNIAEGFVDGNGVFHPIRAASDYNRSRAGEGGTSAAELAKWARRKRRA